jgi:hypothetical protein
MRSLTYVASPHTRDGARVQICWVSDGQALRHAGRQVDLRSGGRHGLRRLLLCLGSTHTTLRTHAPPHHAHALTARAGNSPGPGQIVVAGHIDAGYWWLMAIFYLIIGQGNWGAPSSSPPSIYF